MVKAVVVKGRAPKGRATKAQRLEMARREDPGYMAAHSEAQQRAREALREHRRAFNPVRGLIEALAEGRI